MKMKLIEQQIQQQYKTHISSGVMFSVKIKRL